MPHRFSLKLTPPVVIIFGAGASRGGLAGQPIPPPVDSEFFTVAARLTGHGTPALSKRVLRSVWDLYDRIEGVTLEQYYRELETRASIASIAKSVGKPKDWARRLVDLEELIRRVYVHTTTEEKKGHRVPVSSGPHQAILDALPEGSTILTFNYDMLIEESFRTARLWNPRDGFGVRLPGITHDWARGWLRRHNVPRTATSKVHLLKLHGSLGWASYPNRQVKLKARPYYVSQGRFESVSVLAPGLNKRIHVNPYRHFWGEARLRLQGCKSLLIVGYSLPDTDLLARALFAEVVRLRHAQEAYLNLLVLADPATSVRERFVKLLTPALGPIGRVVHFESLEKLAPVSAPDI